MNLQILAGCVLLGYGSYTSEEAVNDYKFKVFGPWIESDEGKSLLTSLPQKEWQLIQIRAFPGSRQYHLLPSEEKQTLFELDKMNEDFRDANVPLAINSVIGGFFFPYTTLGLLSMNLLTKYYIQKHYLDKIKILSAKPDEKEPQKQPKTQQTEDAANNTQTTTLARIKRVNQFSELALYALPLITILMHASKVKL